MTSPLSHLKFPAKTSPLWLMGLGFVVMGLGLGGYVFYQRHVQPPISDVSPLSNNASNNAFSSVKDLQQQGIFADRVYVKKSTRTLQLLHDGQVIRQYHVALGGTPQGHKQQEGDRRTPEGWYKLDWANEKSGYHRSLHINYPNMLDTETAKKRGISAGGDVMIHGQKNGFGELATVTQKTDWTNGCIAVTNAEMDEIMALVKVGTPILIEW